MAALRKATPFTISLVLSTAQVVHASLPARGFNSFWVKTGAAQSLDRCTWAQSAHWAKLLDKISPEAGVLYRLAWLQISPTTPSTPATEDLPSTSWKWDGELWNDDFDQQSALNQCENPKLKQGGISYFDFSDGVIDSLIQPQAHKYFSFSSDFRRVIRNYLFGLWIRDKKPESLPQQTPEAKSRFKISREEACEWAALRLLHSPSAANPAHYETVLSSCAGVQSPITQAFRIEAGDFYVKENLPKQAFLHYRSAIDTREGQRQSLDPKIWYRLGIASLLGQSHDEIALRSSFKILVPHKFPGKFSGETPDHQTVEPLFQTTLRALLCERMSSLEPKSAVLTLHRVFNPTEFFSQTLALVANCPVEEIQSLLQALLGEAKKPRDQAVLAGKLFKAAILEGSKSKAKNYALRLAQISRVEPYRSSHLFWEALNIYPRNYEDVVAIYRKSSKWTPLDDRRKARWKEFLAKSEVNGSLRANEPRLALKSDKGEAIQPLKLPMTAILPFYRSYDNPVDDFVSLAKNRLRISNESPNP